MWLGFCGAGCRGRREVAALLGLQAVGVHENIVSAGLADEPIEEILHHPLHARVGPLWLGMMVSRQYMTGR